MAASTAAMMKCCSALHCDVAAVGLLAVHDLHHMGEKQGVALAVEFEGAAHALEAYISERIANCGFVLAAGFLNGEQCYGDRIISLSVIGIRKGAIGLLELFDEHLRSGDIASGSAAVMSHVEDAVHRLASELDIFRDRNPVRTEARHGHAELLELLGDERPFGIA